MLSAHNKYISMHNIKIIQLFKRDDEFCKILANQFGQMHRKNNFLSISTRFPVQISFLNEATFT